MLDCFDEGSEGHVPHADKKAKSESLFVTDNQLFMPSNAKFEKWLTRPYCNGSLSGALLLLGGWGGLAAVRFDSTDQHVS